MIEECAIVGAHRIAKYLGMSKSKLKSVHLAELRALGVVFYVRKRLSRRVLCAFPGRLQVWAGEKCAKGEDL